MIELIKINKVFQGRQVLNDISLQFETGKTNLIIGQSGSGKTVLLKSIVGLIEIDKGEVCFDDRNYNLLDFKSKKEVRKEIGMVFQGGALFDSENIEDNVMFPLNMFTEMPREEKLERVNFCLKRVNLINVNSKFPSEISGGMQKRVAIARAIALNPKYLFCDEPNSGLDPQTSIVIDQLISEITHEYNMTTVINTHDMNSVLEMGEKIVFLYQGQKWWEGTSSEILTSQNPELEDFIYATSVMKRLRKGKL
jgi:phospholipid/cholesterol/gamma-HCH transport system ATP-binding protein